LIAPVLEDAFVAIRVGVAVVLARLEALEQIWLLTRVVPALGPQTRVAEASARRSGSRRVGTGHAQPVVRPVDRTVAVEDEVVHVSEPARVDLDVAWRRAKDVRSVVARAIESRIAHIGDEQRG